MDNEDFLKAIEFPSDKKKKTLKEKIIDVHRAGISNTNLVAFAQRFATNGGKILEAMAFAGYKISKNKPTAYTRGHELLAHPLVRKTITDLQEASREKHLMSAGILKDKYMEAYEFAKSMGNPAAMVSAVTGLSRLFGLDKKTHVHEGGDKPIKHAVVTMSLADRLAMLKEAKEVTEVKDAAVEDKKDDL